MKVGEQQSVAGDLLANRVGQDAAVVVASGGVGAEVDVGAESFRRAGDVDAVEERGQLEEGVDVADVFVAVLDEVIAGRGGRRRWSCRRAGRIRGRGGTSVVADAPPQMPVDGRAVAARCRPALPQSLPVVGRPPRFGSSRCSGSHRGHLHRWSCCGMQVVAMVAELDHEPFAASGTDRSVCALGGTGTSISCCGFARASVRCSRSPRNLYSTARTTGRAHGDCRSIVET